MEVLFEETVVADHIDAQMLQDLATIDGMSYDEAAERIEEGHGKGRGRMALQEFREWGLIGEQSLRRGRIYVLRSGWQAVERSYTFRGDLLGFLSDSVFNLWGRHALRVGCENLIDLFRHNVLHPEEWINGDDINGEAMSFARVVLPTAHQHLLDQEKMVDLLIAAVNMSTRFFFPEPKLAILEGRLVPLVLIMAEEHLQLMFEDGMLGQEELDEAVDSLSGLADLPNEARELISNDNLGFSPPEQRFRSWLGLATEPSPVDAWQKTVGSLLIGDRS